MSVVEMPGGAHHTRPDWFAGLDERLPVPLLRHIAVTRQADRGAALTAVMEIARRRTTTDHEGVPTRPTHRCRRAFRSAVIEPAVLPADIGSRFLVELRELVDGDSPRPDGVREQLRICLSGGPEDACRAAADLSEFLARALDLTPTICRAALAVALTDLRSP